MSLPRKIGLIISALFGSWAISSARFFPSMIKASLKPVSIPLFICISQSLSGVPMASILALIRCSISESITQLSAFLNWVYWACCLT